VEVSYEDLPDGKLAAVVTFLDMRKPPQGQVPASALSLRQIPQPDPEDYRRLFRRVGRHWLWFSRLTMSEAELAAIIHDPAVELFVVVDELGTDIGMVELDFREAGECELAFIGLLPELAGLGHGRWLLGETLRLAWREGIRRVHVHTCTLDHPAALPAYRSAGFRAYRRAVEQFPDPRLVGILPSESAPQVPLIGTPLAVPSRPAS
jgi:GNAT superfamily N-acetyltransferase